MLRRRRDHTLDNVETRIVIWSCRRRLSLLDRASNTGEARYSRSELYPPHHHVIGSRVTSTAPLCVNRTTFTVFARSGDPE